MCGEEGKIKGHKNTKKLMIYLRILYFTHTSSINSLHPVAFHVNKSAFIIPFSFHSKVSSRILKNVPHNLVEAGVLRYYGYIVVWELDMVRMERSYMS